MIQRFYFDTSVLGGVFDSEFEEHSTILMERVKLGLIKIAISNVTRKNCIVKTNEKKIIKKYDAVKEMRKIRDKISSEITGMNTEQMMAYFKKGRLPGAKA